MATRSFRQPNSLPSPELVAFSVAVGTPLDPGVPVSRSCVSALLFAHFRAAGIRPHRSGVPVTDELVPLLVDGDAVNVDGVSYVPLASLGCVVTRHLIHAKRHARS